MKMIYLCLLFLFTFSKIALAQKAALTLGLSQVQIQGETGVEISSNGSYQLGALFYQPFSEMMEARIGALLSQEKLTYSTSGVDTGLNLTSIRVPATLGFRLSERVLIFLGPVLHVNASKSCKVSSGACSLSSFKVKGSDVFIGIGGHVQLTDSLGLEVSLDKMTSKPFENTSGGQIINVNFQYLIQ